MVVQILDISIWRAYCIFFYIFLGCFSEVLGWYLTHMSIPDSFMNEYGSEGSLIDKWIY